MLKYQEVGTGNSNPVAYGARPSRRNSPGRWHHRSFCKVQASPPPSPSCSQAKAKAASSSWRDANAAIPAGGGRSFAGEASFYGNESGSKTASGQRFNQNAMTAAHRSLPFGTKLRVTYKGQSVVVTINDRGPFIKGRVLDLSKGAARAVGLTRRRRWPRHRRGHLT